MSNSIFNASNGITNGKWKSNHGSMKIINFAEAEKLEDTYSALGCITVCTSNEKVGTLTHLDTSDINRVEEFVAILDDELGHNKETSKVILSGGSALKESKQLSLTVRQTIEKHGYLITKSYLDHKQKSPPLKVATLERDKVIIREREPGKGTDKFIELDFSGKENIYFKEREIPKTLKRKT